MPGVLPTINGQAVRYTIMTALALNCEIPEYSKFDRKNYMYPDLMKGYQISQYDAPMSHRGWLIIENQGQSKRIGVTRVHLEEDTAKLLHREEPGGASYSLVDVNRAGVPLMEIVSEPDMRSPSEAREYLVKLRSILRYLGVSSGNMEEGSFRCDANISVRPVGSTQLGAKVEIKNMNSFRAVERALAHEAQRQVHVIEEGGRIVQQTRGWVDDRGVTVEQRTKEFAHDYRYFPEPDLPPLVLSRELVEEVRASLPELPDVKRERLATQYGLSDKTAALLAESRAMADFYEETVSLSPSTEAMPRNVANWMIGELRRLLTESSKELNESPLTPSHIAELMGLLDQKAISDASGKEVFEAMFREGHRAQALVAERGLARISASGELDSIIADILAGNPQAVADFHSGKAAALAFLVGQVMRATRGKADPAVTTELLRQRLAEVVG